MPVELVERVLLFLPFSSQIRFQAVCKLWREVMTTKRFRDETALTALRPSCSATSLCAWKLKHSKADTDHELLKKQVKMRKLHFPGLVVPESHYAALVTSEAVPMVALLVACRDYGCVDDDDYELALAGASPPVRIWLLNLAQQTWRELPPLPTRYPDYWAPDSLWLVPGEGTDNFKVLAIREKSENSDAGKLGRLCFFSYEDTIHASASQSPQCWRKCRVVAKDSEESRAFDFSPHCQWVIVSGGKYVIHKSGDLELPGPQAGIRRLCWEGQLESAVTLSIPRLNHSLRRKEFRMLSNSAEGCNENSLYVYGFDYATENDFEEPRGLFLYKLNESTREWKCLFSDQLPPSRFRNLRPNSIASPHSDLYMNALYAIGGHVAGDCVFISIRVSFTTSANVCRTPENSDSGTVMYPVTYYMAYHMVQETCTWFPLDDGHSVHCDKCNPITTWTRSEEHELLESPVLNPHLSYIYMSGRRPACMMEGSILFYYPNISFKITCGVRQRSKTVGPPEKHHAQHPFVCCSGKSDSVIHASVPLGHLRLFYSVCCSILENDAA